WQDWVFGNTQGAGLPAPQYAQAILLARQVEAIYGTNVRITGHSLGGGVGSAGSMASGVPADTVDPAGLDSNTLPAALALDPKGSDIQAYSTDGDILTTLQNHSPAPDAVGHMHHLKAVDMTTGPDGQPVFTPRPNPIKKRGFLGSVLHPIQTVKDLL